MKLILPIISVSCLLVGAAAFAPFSPNHGHYSRRMTVHGYSSSSRSSRLYYWMPRDELERIRASLEDVVARQQPSGDDPPAFILEGVIAQAEAQDMLLTSAGKAMREVEMELLSRLVHSDDALEELIHLWTTEGNAQAAADLLEMQEECSKGLVEEEARLRLMTTEFPNWSEPFSRLAALFYYKGQIDQALLMAERALELKPWHFEAAQLFVHLSRQVNDEESVMEWTSRLLPPLKTEKERRAEWVKQALEEASQRYQQADQVTTDIRSRVSPRDSASILFNAWQ